MQQTLKNLQAEVPRLAVHFGIAVFAVWSLSRKHVVTGTADIRIADTYLIVPNRQLLLLLFLSLSFFMYFGRQMQHPAKRVPGNAIAAIVGLSLLIAITFQLREFSAIRGGIGDFGMPTSGLKADDHSPDAARPVIMAVTGLFLVYQGILLTMLGYGFFRMKKQRVKQEASNG